MQPVAELIVMHERSCLLAESRVVRCFTYAASFMQSTWLTCNVIPVALVYRGVPALTLICCRAVIPVYAKVTGAALQVIFVEGHASGNKCLPGNAAGHPGM